MSHFTAAQDTPRSEPARKPIEAKKPDYSPYPDQKFPNRVLWGAAHNHTSYSFDSGMFGVTLGPDALFKFATGGEVVVDNGVRVKIDRPMDWLAITDHAEYLGLAEEIATGSPELLADPVGKKWYEASKRSPEAGVEAAIEAVITIKNGVPAIKSEKLTKAAWGAPPRPPRSGTSPAFSPRCTASNGRLHQKARIFIAPSFFATTRTA